MRAATANLIPTVRLFARLLLRELDAGLLAELEQPEVAAALDQVGIALPATGDLEDLRATYVELFLHPRRGAPPIASLWADGKYEGDSAIALRRLAAAADCEFDRDVAGGAPVDHLGCVLLLWCACAETAPDLANLIASEHLTWVHRALELPSAYPGFYGQLSRATATLVATLAA